jgi:hypothetical protein
MSAQGRKLRKTKPKNKYEQRVTCSKLSAVVVFANFHQKEQSWKEKVDDFEAKSNAKSAFEVVANEVYSLEFRTKYHLRMRRESD